MREPIEVRISPEEIVVVNYPGPDRAVRLDQLCKGKAVPRRYRNRRIGDFLKELDITEGRSTGIPKILRAMKKNGSPPPQFDFDDEHSYFLLRLPVHSKERLAAKPKEPTTGQVTGQVVPWMADALEACSSAPRKSSEIQIAVGIRHRETFQRNYLDKLVTEGFVAMTIPDKPNSRLQKYRLTAKGKAVLESQRK